ncbi:MAG: hypothetical protein GF331_27335 [Chitinivibrionales bacterium]|nr:hypothetical protein [Chitinivibrionales bacterium]
MTLRQQGAARRAGYGLGLGLAALLCLATVGCGLPMVVFETDGLGGSSTAAGGGELVAVFVGPDSLGCADCCTKEDGWDCPLHARPGEAERVRFMIDKYASSMAGLTSEALGQPGAVQVGSTLPATGIGLTSKVNFVYPSLKPRMHVVVHIHRDGALVDSVEAEADKVLWGHLAWYAPTFLATFPALIAIPITILNKAMHNGKERVVHEAMTTAARLTAERLKQLAVSGNLSSHTRR